VLAASEEIEGFHLSFVAAFATLLAPLQYAPSGDYPSHLSGIYPIVWIAANHYINASAVTFSDGK